MRASVVSPSRMETAGSRRSPRWSFGAGEILLPLSLFYLTNKGDGGQQTKPRAAGEPASIPKFQNFLVDVFAPISRLSGNGLATAT